jgi:drug/metabolite transporter (DMT)-like permease
VIAKDLFAIRARTWGACFVALLGVAVIGLDSQSGRIQDGSLLSSFLSSFDSLTPGDFLIVLAAFSYTFHCIRLGVFAKETSALKLAACKAATETLLSLTLVLTLVAAGQHESSIDGLTSYASREGSDITKFLSSFAENVSSGTLPSATLLPAAGAVLWTGLVTVAYTIYAQSFGQSRVNPTDANLIYTIQPLFTALVAWALLGETLGPAGYVGGALIGSAVYLVAIDDSSNDSGEKFEPIEDSADETESLVEPELKSGT